MIETFTTTGDRDTVDAVIADWADVLINQAADVVPEAIVSAEANAIVNDVDGAR